MHYERKPQLKTGLCINRVLQKDPVELNGNDIYSTNQYENLLHYGEKHWNTFDKTQSLPDKFYVLEPLYFLDKVQYL